MARKESNIHYIYKTTCKVTGRYYVGMHSTSKLDDGYMGSGKRLRRSIRKYGKNNHEKVIIEFFDSKELLVEAEEKAITPEMITDNNCMNLAKGGTGGHGSRFLTKEQLAKGGKISVKIYNDRLKTDINFRVKIKKVHYDRLKNLWGDIKYRNKILGNLDWSGKKHKQKSKDKIGKANSIKQKGENNSQYGTCWVTKEGVNKKIRKEDINKFNSEGWVKGRK